MNKLKKIYDYFVELQGWIALLLVTLTIILNFVEIMQRNFLGKSFIWIQELSTLLLLWFALLGMSKIVNDGQEIKVTLLIDRFSARARFWIKLIMDFFVTLFLIYALVYSTILFSEQIGSYSMVMEYPLELKSLPLMIGFFTMGIRYAANFIDGLSHLLSGKRAGGASI